MAARASILLAVALVIMVIAAWLLFLLDPDSVPWRHAMTLWRILLDVVLVIVIPIVTYRALLVWLEGEQSRFPDIDYAWNAGVEALRRNGIPLESAPIFLVLGSSGQRLEQSLFEGSARSFRVANVPEGPAPLHWYASPEAIFLCCTEAGWLTALAALQARRETEVESPQPLQPEVPAVAPIAAPAGQPSGPHGGTLVLDQFLAAGDTDDRTAGGDVKEAKEEGTERVETARTARIAPASVAAGPVVIPEGDSARELERLEYVCRLVRRGRQPVCGLNGVLTLLPIGQLQATPAEVEQLRRAIKADLTIVRETARLRTSTIAVVTDLEQERGFRELVRRVGRDRAAAQRFGQKFDVRRFATEEDLTALSAHVCGAFEDWIYALFREKGALSRPGNTHLYGLLCKVRCNLKTRFDDILSRGYGYDPHRQPDDQRSFFSGCYFAATGQTADRQAFVKAVIDKIVEENELIEWTDKAWSEHRRYRRLTIIGYALAALLLVFTIGAVIYRQLY